jgi:hypothetical protein
MSDKKIFILYTCDPEFKKAYAKLIKMYPTVRFSLETSMKNQIIAAMKGRYTLFLVDDDVMIRKFPKKSPELSEFNKNKDILSFNIGLGRNYDYDFLKNRHVPIPEFKEGTWEWRKYRHDWGFPMGIGLDIYRTNELLPVIKNINFATIHDLERGIRGKIDKPLMIGFNKARIVNIPSNRVTASLHRTGNVSTSYLNDKFMNGYIIDLTDIVKKAKDTRSFFMLMDYKWIKSKIVKNR